MIGFQKKLRLTANTAMWPIAIIRFNHERKIILGRQVLWQSRRLRQMMTRCLFVLNDRSSDQMCNTKKKPLGLNALRLFLMTDAIPS